MIIIIILAIFLSIIALFVALNPKVRGKIIATKIKSVNYATRETKDEIAELSSTIKDAIKKDDK